MNFTLCVLLVYNDNGSVQTLCTKRANVIIIINIATQEWNNCDMEFEVAIFVVKGSAELAIPPNQ